MFSIFELGVLRNLKDRYIKCFFPTHFWDYVKCYHGKIRCKFFYRYKKEEISFQCLLLLNFLLQHMTSKKKEMC